MKTLALLASGIVCAGLLAGESLAQPFDQQECRPHFHFPRTSAPTSAWSVKSLCQSYQFPTGLTGGGVIGILELGGGYSQADLDSFSQLNGMPKIAVTTVSVNGGTNSYGRSSADYEVELDIEVAAAAYYYATGKMPTIKVFFAPNSTASFVNVINAAVSNGCDVLSISWGAPESYWSSSSAQQLESVASTAASKGLVIFAASGDYSSSDGASGTNVDMPAACPHIIGCGGTRKTSSSEVVWGDGKSTDGGTGGGYSKLFPKQSWQTGAPSTSGRMVPDVSANADPNTGYLIVVRGTQVIVGGTSAVSPLYAGLFAAFKKKLGFVTPSLWSHPSDFLDITSGSNGAYAAVKGPDPCTGLGSPKGSTLATLFGAPHGSFTIAAVGATSGASSDTVTVNHPANAILSFVAGNGLGGNFAGVVFDPTSLGGAGALIYGVGGGLNSSGFDVFTFSGRN